MEYKVLSGPFNAGELERDLNGHAAEGWRVAGTFQAISWMKSRTPTVIVLKRARAEPGACAVLDPHRHTQAVGSASPRRG
jgi:hypothetical protein